MSNERIIARRRCNRRGASTVEAAIVLPLVFLFLFGILEYGRYVMMLQIATNAAREGAHYAVTHTNPITISGVTYGNGTSDVVNTVNTAMGGQRLSGQNVQIYTSDTLGNNLGTWTDTEAGQSICCRITGNYQVMLAQMLHLPSTIPVVAQAVMRSESN